jgi:thiamine kinase-like enzyme
MSEINKNKKDDLLELDAIFVPVYPDKNASEQDIANFNLEMKQIYARIRPQPEFEAIFKEDFKEKYSASTIEALLIPEDNGRYNIQVEFAFEMWLRSQRREYDKSGPNKELYQQRTQKFFMNAMEGRVRINEMREEFTGNSSNTNKPKV